MRLDDLHKDLVDDTLAALMHPRMPARGVCAVLPPCTAAEQFVPSLRKALAARGASVAVVSADAVRSSAELANELARQWALPAPRDLDHVLAVSATEGRVCVLDRFHKILDAIDDSVLGKFRTYEQQGAFQIVAVSPYDYSDLQRRWREAGHKLLVSNFGDQHHRKAVDLDRLLPRVRDAARRAEIPDHVTDYVAELTGNLPLPFVQVLQVWEHVGRPDLLREAQSRLADVARDAFRGFVERIEAPPTTDFRRALLALHLELDPTAEALALIEGHPWQRDSHLLLDGSGRRLRASALGAAARESLLAADGLAGRFELARKLYRHHQYDAVARLLEGRAVGTSDDALLHAHAVIMRAVRPGDHTAIDADWQPVAQALHAGRRIVDQRRAALAASAEALLARYARIEHFASAVSSAKSAAPGGRIVDHLAASHDEHDRRCAVALLALEVEAVRQMAGDHAACQAALALPEQIFRVWARWVAQLDQDYAPDDAHAWAEVTEWWSRGNGSRLEKCGPGRRFRSFPPFAALALVRARRDNPRAAMPESDLDHLGRALTLFQHRNGLAHALTVSDSDTRRTMFELIERWLGALTAALGAVSAWSLIDELQLPYVGLDLELSWDA